MAIEIQLTRNIVTQYQIYILEFTLFKPPEKKIKSKIIFGFIFFLPPFSLFYTITVIYLIDHKQSSNLIVCMICQPIKSRHHNYIGFTVICLIY